MVFTNFFKADLVKLEELLSLLDELPLTISQAATYIHETGIRLEKYLQLYKQ
jgi:hypothetical protein